MEKRLYVVFGLFILILIAVLARLFYWQVFSSDRLRIQAERQTLTSSTILAKRGKIYTNDGTPIVLNQRAFLLFIEPEKIKNKRRVLTTLAKELEIPKASISAKLENQNLKWVPIAHQLDEERMKKINKYSFPSVGFRQEAKRFYPEASMAAHLLGFVGKNYKGEDQGYFGLEGYYDEQLRGRDGLLRQEADALGNPIIQGRNEEIAAEDGRDLYLTIDKTVQFIIEDKLSEGIERYKAVGGSVIVIDPVKGAIIAMASYPSYDPGRFSEFPQKFYKNPAISSSYEPGSTFKVLVVASALNEGKVKTDDKFNEEGPIKIGKYFIRTWNQKYHGIITLPEILKYSSNVGMVFVARKLGDERLIKYIKNIGLGEKTGIDLQGESTPTVRPKKKWHEIDYATASFGQGIAVTPLQMVRAVAAIANEGKLMSPFVVKKIGLSNGKVINIKPKVEKKVFKKEVAAVTAEMMAEAVEDGEARFAKPKGYRIAGKTGTAQIPIAGHYDTKKTIASFVGFAPVHKPKFVMLVSLREPSASPWGSETAAPLFFAISKELFSYYSISPSD